MPAVNAAPKRRKAPRVDLRAHVEIDLPKPPPSETPTNTPTRLQADSLNLSEGGLCVRLREPLNVRSQVRLRLFAEPDKKPLECAGRVAWVVQRMDPRFGPPFLYDIGLEFVDPSPQLRQFVARAGLEVKTPTPRPKPVLIQPVTINGRTYVPRLEREPRISAAWHLIIWVEEIPCFSCHYASQKEATDAWEQFKRKTARPVAIAKAAAKRAARPPAKKSKTPKKPRTKAKTAKRRPKAKRASARRKARRR